MGLSVKVHIYIFVFFLLSAPMSFGAEEEFELEDFSAISLHELFFENNMPRFIRAVLRFKHDVDEYDDFGRSVLHLAAEQNKVNWIQLTLALGADIDAPDGQRAIPPIEYARYSGQNDAYRVLIKYGAKVVMPHRLSFCRAR